MNQPAKADIKIDPELSEMLSGVLRELNTLLTQEELDALLKTHRVMQARNQYEYILRITKARHGLRLFAVEKEVETLSILYVAAHKLFRVEQIATNILKKKRILDRMIDEYRVEVDRRLNECSKIRHPELRLEMERTNIVDFRNTYAKINALFDEAISTLELDIASLRRGA